MDERVTTDLVIQALFIVTDRKLLEKELALHLDNARSQRDNEACCLSTVCSDVIFVKKLFCTILLYVLRLIQSINVRLNKDQLLKL
ncbi:hypothetical protein SAMN05421755_11152 [Nitrosomonas sp. Nm33]|nr:hypothetical protein SAMN05421755_11152 [Nitrosomonas sp. Nm33]